MPDASNPGPALSESIMASLGRIAGLSRRIIRQLATDRRTLAFVVVVPAVIMTLLYFLTNISPTPPRVAVVPPAFPEPAVASEWQQAMIDALQKSGRVVPEAVPAAYAGDPARAVTDGQVYAVVLLPDLTAGVARGVHVDVIVEGSDPAATGAVLAALNQALPSLQPLIMRAGTRSRSGRTPGTGTAPGPGTAVAPGTQTPAAPSSPPVSVAVDYIHARDFKLMDFFAPVFIPFFVFFFTFLLTVVSFLRERTGGTMERLLASPIGAAEIILGYLGGFLLFALIESLIVLIFTIYVLKIHYQGSLLSIFVVEAFLTVLGVNLGIFLSTYARNELQAVQFIPVVILPQALLAETFWKVADMPWVLRTLAYALPLTYSNLALKDIMLRGASLGDVGWYLVVLGAYALAAVGLSAIVVRRTT